MIDFKNLVRIFWIWSHENASSIVLDQRLISRLGHIEWTYRHAQASYWYHSLEVCQWYRKTRQLRSTLRLALLRVAIHNHLFSLSFQPVLAYSLPIWYLPIYKQIYNNCFKNLSHKHWFYIKIFERHVTWKDLAEVDPCLLVKYGAFLHPLNHLYLNIQNVFLGI